MLITGFLLPGDSGLIACYLSDFFVVPLQSWSLRCYKWLVLNWRKYAIKNNSCNSSNDLMRLMEALQFNSVGSTGCEARLNTAASLIYQLIKCYLLSHPMNKYVVITVAAVLQSAPTLFILWNRIQFTSNCFYYRQGQSWQNCCLTIYPKTQDFRHLQLDLTKKL